MRILSAALVTFAIFCMLGCSNDSVSPTAKKQADDSAIPSGANKMPSVAESESGAQPVEKHKPATKEELDALGKTQADAEQALKKSPKDTAAKQTYIDATLNLAHATEGTDTMDNKVKYKKAYLLYQAVLTVDPQNQAAQDAVQMYDSIYKSMNKPSPKADGK